jgi:hypothetical protein
VKVLGGVDVEVAVLDLEPGRRASRPLLRILIGANAGAKSRKFLLVFDLSEVAHQLRDHAVNRLLEFAVVDADLQPDVEGHSSLVNTPSNISWRCFWAEFRTITPATVRNSGLKQMLIA